MKSSRHKIGGLRRHSPEGKWRGREARGTGEGKWKRQEQNCGSCILLVMGIELRTSYLLGRFCAAELQPQPWKPHLRKQDMQAHEMFLEGLHSTGRKMCGLHCDEQRPFRKNYSTEYSSTSGLIFTSVTGYWMFPQWSLYKGQCDNDDMGKG